MNFFFYVVILHGIMWRSVSFSGRPIKEIINRLRLNLPVSCLFLYVFKSQTCSNDRGDFCQRQSPDHVNVTVVVSYEGQQNGHRVFCWWLKTPGAGGQESQQDQCQSSKDKVWQASLSFQRAPSRNDGLPP